MVTPRGYWWEGVTWTARGSGQRAIPASGSRPSSSTGTGTRRAPAMARTSRARSQAPRPTRLPGSSSTQAGPPGPAGSRCHQHLVRLAAHRGPSACSRPPPRGTGASPWGRRTSAGRGAGCGHGGAAGSTRPGTGSGRRPPRWCGTRRGPRPRARAPSGAVPRARVTRAGARAGPPWRARRAPGAGREATAPRRSPTRPGSRSSPRPGAARTRSAPGCARSPAPGPGRGSRAAAAPAPAGARHSSRYPVKLPVERRPGGHGDDRQDALRRPPHAGMIVVMLGS
jgi:hypothetical protein